MGKKTRRILFMILSLVMLFTGTVGQVQARVLENSRRTVKIGYYIIPGFQEYDEATDTYSGYSYEYLLALAQYANWEYEFVPVTFAQGVEMLENGQLDLMNNVSITSERQQTLSFSTYPSGTNCAYLATAPDNKTIAYDDFQNFDDITVALNRSSIYNDQLIEYCRDNGCMPKLIYYDTRDEVIAAVDNGEADARIITASQNVDMHIIAKFAPENYYFAVPKADTELAQQLNQAMSSLNTNDPDFQNRLQSKYYGNVADTNTVFTSAEQAYIKQHDTIKVAYDRGCYPLSFEDSSGEFCGTIADIYQRLSEQTGIKFQFYAADAADIADNNLPPDVQLFAELPYDYIWASQYGINLSTPFADITVMEVRREGFSDASGTMAVVRGYYLSQLCQDTFGDQYTYQEYDSTEECMQAVVDGDVDVTCLSSYEGEYYQSQSQCRNLLFSVSQDLHYSLSIGVIDTANPCLATILMKGLNAISQDEINAMFQNTSLHSRESDLLSSIIAHPIWMIVVVTILTLLLAGLIFALVYVRTMHRKNRQLSEAMEKAQQADRAKSDFLSRMSHDMRTPLNVIIGMSKLAEDNENPPDTRDCLGKIDISSEFLLGLVNDVLDMERMEDHKVKLNPVPYSGEEFASYLDAVIRPLCEQKNIILTYTCTDTMDFAVMQDKMRINQIYFNILSNAVKFTPEGGRIDFRTVITPLEQHRLGMDVTITDTGIGMSQEFQKKMFEPFEQENQVMTSVSVGTGLGLSIVKTLCELMGMTIRVESELGKGTTFYIHGEYEQTEPQTKADGSIESAKGDNYTSLQGKEILVCEDHMLNQEIIQRLLEKQGVNVTLEADGRAGVEAFHQSIPGSYAAILMDIRMPFMDGLEASRKIRQMDRKDASTIPIIAMTANAYDEDIEESLAAGMNEHLCKPIDPQKLYRTLAKYIK